MSLPERVLITGASSGLGAAFALHYAAPGVTLFLSGRDDARLTAVARRCSQKGATCELAIFDHRDLSELETWLLEVTRHDPPQLAILNAGVASTRIDEREGERPSDIAAIIDTNLKATVVAAQLLGRAFVEQGSGHLALISSLNGLYPVVEAPTYSATKAALLAYGQAAREWLEPYGVKITIICPGFVRTAIAERYRGLRPFELEPATAARIAARGIARNRAIVAFPRPLTWAIGVARLTPRAVQRAILRHYTANLPPLR